MVLVQCAHTYTHAHAHTQTRKHTQTNTHTHKHTQASTFLTSYCASAFSCIPLCWHLGFRPERTGLVGVCMCACVHVCMSACLYGCMCACLYVHVCMCMCVGLYVCMCMFVCACVHVHVGVDGDGQTVSALCKRFVNALYTLRACTLAHSCPITLSRLSIHALMHSCTHALTHLCVYVCMHSHSLRLAVESGRRDHRWCSGGFLAADRAQVTTHRADHVCERED